MGDFLYSIKKKDDHYEVYINNEFYCSTDTIEEAASEIKELM